MAALLSSACFKNQIAYVQGINFRLEHMGGFEIAERTHEMGFDAGNARVVFSSGKPDCYVQ